MKKLDRHGAICPVCGIFFFHFSCSEISRISIENEMDRANGAVCQNTPGRNHR